MTTKSVASTCLLSKTKSSFFLLRAAGHPPIGNSRIWTYVPERIDSKIYTMDNYRDDIDDEMMMIMRWDNVISVKLHDHHPFQEWKGDRALVGHWRQSPNTGLLRRTRCGNSGFWCLFSSILQPGLPHFSCNTYWPITRVVVCPIGNVFSYGSFFITPIGSVTRASFGWLGCRRG